MQGGLNIQRNVSLSCQRQALHSGVRRRKTLKRSFQLCAGRSWSLFLPCMIFELPMCPVDFSKMWKPSIWETPDQGISAWNCAEYPRSLAITINYNNNHNNDNHNSHPNSNHNHANNHKPPPQQKKKKKRKKKKKKRHNHTTTARPVMSSLDETQQGPPMILRQPVEIITIIFSLVDPADLKSLRQTYRDFDPVAASFLFRNITISRLRACHNAFFHICDSPHLACHVREVVWNELAAVNLASAISQHWAQSADGCLRDDEGEELVRRLSSMASDSDLFWLLPPDTSSPEDVDGDAAVFRRRFVDALRRLPKLNSLVSRPMPTEKCLRPGEWALTAGFARNAAVDHDPTNRGFFDFLIPALFHLEDRITELQFIDEAPPNLLGYSARFHAAAFAHLTSIQFGLDRWNSHPQLVLDDPDVVNCLQAASALQDLRLVVDGPNAADMAIFSRIFTIDGRTRQTMKWRHLRSLSLDGFRVKGDDLVSFVRVHVATLRHLRTADVWVTLETIESLRAITGLQLSSFQIEYSHGFCLPHGKTLPEMVSEGDLLPYVNGCTPQSPVPHVPKQSSICTMYHVWHTIQQLCPFQRSFDDSTPHETSYRESDRDAALLSYWDTMEDINYSLDSDDSEEWDDDWGKEEWDYSEESEEMDDVWDSAQSWTWGRFYHQDMNGTVFFWRVPGGTSGSHPTKTWKMTRGGQEFFFQREKGILEPPEEYFEDWDDAVDRIEATPYRSGSGFDKPLGLGELMGPGQAGIFEKLKASKPPPDAMEWTSEDDPCWLLAHDMATCFGVDGIMVIERLPTEIGELEGSEEPHNSVQGKGCGQPGTRSGGGWKPWIAPTTA